MAAPATNEAKWWELRNKCRDGDVSGVQEGLSRGEVDIDYQRRVRGATLLHVACRYGRDDVVRVLIDLRARVDIRDNANRTARDLIPAANATTLRVFDEACQQREARSKQAEGSEAKRKEPEVETRRKEVEAAEATSREAELSKRNVALEAQCAEQARQCRQLQEQNVTLQKQLQKQVAEHARQLEAQATERGGMRAELEKRIQQLQGDVKSLTREGADMRRSQAELTERNTALEAQCLKHDGMRQQLKEESESLRRQLQDQATERREMRRELEARIQQLQDDAERKEAEAKRRHAELIQQHSTQLEEQAMIRRELEERIQKLQGDAHACRAAIAACRAGDVAQLAQQIDVVGVNRELDHNGNTALHIAAIADHAAVVKFLLEREALLSVRNAAGQTPLDVAVGDLVRRFCNRETVKPRPPYDGLVCLTLVKGQTMEPLKPTPQESSVLAAEYFKEGDLPPGLIFESSTGIISGCPTQLLLDACSVSVSAINELEQSEPSTFVIRVTSDLGLGLVNLNETFDKYEKKLLATFKDVEYLRKWAGGKQPHQLPAMIDEILTHDVNVETRKDKIDLSDWLQQLCGVESGLTSPNITVQLHQTTHIDGYTAVQRHLSDMQDAVVGVDEGVKMLHEKK